MPSSNTDLGARGTSASFGSVVLLGTVGLTITRFLFTTTWRGAGRPYFSAIVVGPLTVRLRFTDAVLAGDDATLRGTRPAFATSSSISFLSSPPALSCWLWPRRRIQEPKVIWWCLFTSSERPTSAGYGCGDMATWTPCASPHSFPRMHCDVTRTDTYHHARMGVALGRGRGFVRFGVELSGCD